MIIDVEGQEFKIPDSINYKSALSLVVSEVSCIFIENNVNGVPSKISRAFTTRLIYDLEPFLKFQQNVVTYNFLNLTFKNTFRGQAKCSYGMKSEKAREKIFQIMKELKVDKIFAKVIFYLSSKLFLSITVL